MEIGRIQAAAPGLVTHPLEKFGLDELYAEGKTAEEALLEILVRVCRELGVGSGGRAARVPAP